MQGGSIVAMKLGGSGDVLGSSAVNEQGRRLPIRSVLNGSRNVVSSTIATLSSTSSPYLIVHCNICVKLCNGAFERSSQLKHTSLKFVRAKLSS